MNDEKLFDNCVIEMKKIGRKHMLENKNDALLEEEFFGATIMYTLRKALKKIK